MPPKLKRVSSPPRSPFTFTTTYLNVSLKYPNRHQLLGIEAFSNLDFGQFIECKVEAAKKLDALVKAHQCLTPGQLLCPYKAQVLSFVEYYY